MKKVSPISALSFSLLLTGASTVLRPRLVHDAG